jgi:hypothetical protein
MSETARGQRTWIFVALCAAAAILVAGYAAVSMRRSSSNTATNAAALLSAPPTRPYLIAQSTAERAWRRLVLTPLSALDGPVYATSLICDRAYFAGGRGICLVEEPGIGPSSFADIFDERFNRVHRLPLTGIPSRARVSVDGRRAGVTVFEQGHSYGEGRFSTRTSIIDLEAGRSLGDLEQFAITRDGRRFQAVDFNFWGITFAADGDRFYATLATAGVKYLVEGSVDRREARVVRTGVECPSLSPDNTRIVYKSMTTSSGEWQLRVFDVKTGADTALTSETRSVDDQVDWLDNDHVMYSLIGSNGADIWSLRVDDHEPPRLLMPAASSPAVVR